VTPLVEDDASAPFRGVSELELRFRKEGGRWALGSDVVEAGNSRR
jgi:hypothetical protein